MTFKAGQSGNPSGRRRGSPNRRSQLAKLLEPHAQDLIAKAVELALAGDVAALRLCVERLIPKAEHTPIELDLPDEINHTNLLEVKSMILRAALDGKLSVIEAERLALLISHQVEMTPPLLPSRTFPTDPNEAARIYQEFMRG